MDRRDGTVRKTRLLLNHSSFPERQRLVHISEFRPTRSSPNFSTGSKRRGPRATVAQRRRKRIEEIFTHGIMAQLQDKAAVANRREQGTRLA
jgi:hypothetical protein